VVLCKKNEEAENYEFAAVLNDVVNNFDTVNKIKPSPKKTPVVKKKPTVTPEGEGKESDRESHQ